MASNPPAKDSATSVRRRRRCQPSFPGSSPVFTALSWCPPPPVQSRYKLDALVKYTVKVYWYDVGYTMLVHFDFNRNTGSDKSRFHSAVSSQKDNVGDIQRIKTTKTGGWIIHVKMWLAILHFTASQIFIRNSNLSLVLSKHLKPFGF